MLPDLGIPMLLSPCCEHQDAVEGASHVAKGTEYETKCMSKWGLKTECWPGTARVFHVQGVPP